MKFLYQIYTLVAISISLGISSFGQTHNQKNLIKIANAFIEFQHDSLKNLNKDNNILIIGAISIDKDSIRVGIGFVPSGLLYDMKYEKLYGLKGFKVIIPTQGAELDRSYILKGLFKEIPYENLNKADKHFLYHPKIWSVTLNNNNEVVSVESEYRFKDVVRKLRKNKVKFAKNFHFIQNLSWQTDDR